MSAIECSDCGWIFADADAYDAHDCDGMEVLDPARFKSRGGRPKRAAPRVSVVLRLEPDLLAAIDGYVGPGDTRHGVIVDLISRGLRELNEVPGADDR